MLRPWESHFGESAVLAQPTIRTQTNQNVGWEVRGLVLYHVRTRSKELSAFIMIGLLPHPDFTPI